MVRTVNPVSADSSTLAMTKERALTVSKATGRAAVSQASRVSPATSVQIHPSTERNVTKSVAVSTVCVITVQAALVFVGEDPV